MKIHDQSPDSPQHGTRMRRARTPDGELPRWYRPLADPRWLGVGHATHMQGDDPVLGLEFDGRTWALPWWIMKNHHVANLVLDNRAVLVALCAMCSSAAAFDPVMDGRRHAFRFEGLYNGTIMLQDDETRSLWTGFTGEAIEGPMKDRVMERLPLLQCTWAEWIASHPGTLVPDGAGESRDGHGEGQSPGSPFVGPVMRGLLQNVDRRLAHHELVLGVRVGGGARCYPLSALAQHGPVVNDTLGGEDIAVFCRPGSWIASAYSRRVDGNNLTFRAKGDAIVDDQTGSRWEISGKAGAGPLTGRQLRYVHSGIEEFYIWAAFNPGAGIFGLDPSAGAATRPRQGVWSLDAVPDPVQRVMKNGWWRRGMTLLDVACGDGLVAAWLAESGLDVVAMDMDPGIVARARQNFRGISRLKIEVADIRQSAPPGRKFDAVVDHGLFHRLAAGERSAYLTHIAAAAKPGCRFLLLAPIPAQKIRQLVPKIRELFQPAFDLASAREASLPDPATGAGTVGAVFRFIRRQADERRVGTDT